MSASTDAAPGLVPVGEPLSVQELTEVLIKHHGLHDGRYDLLVQFQFGAGSVGPDEDNRLPSVFVAVSKLGLAKADAASKLAVDAALVNPKKLPGARKAK